MRRSNNRRALRQEHSATGADGVCSGVLYSVDMGARRGGLTPACGSAHVRDGRGCRKIEATSATVLPRGALRSCPRLSKFVEQIANEKTIRCTLNPTQEIQVLPGWQRHGAPYSAGSKGVRSRLYSSVYTPWGYSRKYRVLV